MAMLGAQENLFNPIVLFVLRAALGAYIVYAARSFYVDPLGYFRRWMPQLPELLWMKLLIRFIAAFCVWGGCFILATAIATQILDQHGLLWAVALVLLAIIATWFLLPNNSPISQDSESDPGNPSRSG